MQADLLSNEDKQRNHGPNAHTAGAILALRRIHCKNDGVFRSISY